MRQIAAIRTRRCKQAGENRNDVAGGRAACARRQTGQTAGFTLTEALATVIIVGLVTSILAGGIALATRQYTQSMSNSEAQMLYSSLQKILDTELRFTGTIETDASGKVIGFESKHYKAKKEGEDPIGTSKLCSIPADSDGTIAQDPSTPGQLGMASALGSGVVTNTFLGSGAYNYGLLASVHSLTYSKDRKCFTVNLVISQGSGSDALTLVDETFTVRALNVQNV